jgi:hypothetical protein
VSCLMRVLQMIEATVSKTQLQAHVRATNSTKAVVISNVSREDLASLQKSLQKQILKNRNSIIIILPS